MQKHARTRNMAQKLKSQTLPRRGPFYKPGDIRNDKPVESAEVRVKGGEGI